MKGRRRKEGEEGGKLDKWVGSTGEKKGSKEEVGEGTMVQNSLIWRNQNSYFPTSFGVSVVSKQANK